MTVDSRDTKYKAEALQEWLAGRKDKIVGGIIANVSNVWRVNNKKEYNYDPNYKDWGYLDELF